jgi:ABC-type histidine transport system ATPase subunit
MNKIRILIICLITISSYSQSDVDKILKGGEIIINGLSFLKKDKSEAKETNSKVVESVCIKNKLTDKITFIISGKDAEDNSIKKELVIQKDGKECVFELPKGIYTYEIVLANKEVYKKGEYKFNEEITITVKPD